MKNKICSFFIFFFVFLSSLTAQIPDSVKLKINKLSHDTLKIKYLNDYADIIFSYDVDLALNALKHSEQLCKGKNYDRYYADILMIRLIHLPYEGRFEEAQQNGLKGFSFAKQKKLYNEFANFNFNYGTLKFQQRQYDSAIYYFQNAIHKFTPLKDTLSLAQIYFNLSNVYEELGKIDSSLQMLKIALKMNKAMNRSKGIANCYNGIGLLYQDQNKHDEAIKHFKKSYEIRIDDNESLRASIPATNMANSYLALGNYKEAYKIMKWSVATKEKFNDKRTLLNAYLNLASIYYKLDSIPQAHRYYSKTFKLAEEMHSDYHKHLAALNLIPLWTDQRKSPKLLIEKLKACENYFLEIGNTDDLKNTHEHLYKKYLEINDFKSAFQHLYQYDSLRFILHNEEATKTLEEFKVQYETAKKESEIKELKIKDFESMVKIQQQHNRNNLLSSSIVFIFILVGLFFTLIRAKQKREKMKATLAVEHAERQRIARDMHDELGSGLSKMLVLSQMLEKNESSSAEIKKYGNSVKETSVKLLENMSSLVWSLNPEHQTADAFIERLRDYFLTFMENLGVESEFKVNGTCSSKYRLGRDLVKNIYPACKEAINNALKHAEADKISIEITLNDAFISFRICDNGKGYSSSKSNGNGLKNMEKRIRFCKGKLEIKSILNKGTEIWFKDLPLEKV
jgi:signal transduction histidine kinase/Tfp pilus assembly protein PilF